MAILTPQELIGSGEGLFTLPKLYFELQEALDGYVDAFESELENSEG